jgi:hypothetical protein
MCDSNLGVMWVRLLPLSQLIYWVAPHRGPGDMFEEALAYTRSDEEQIKSEAVHKDLRLRPPTLTSPNGSQQYYAI